MVFMPHWPKFVNRRGAGEYNLDTMYTVLSRLQDPHLSIPPVVHVTGTNGKGSTVAYLYAMLKAAGLRVHVYTSPHLLHVNERIHVANSQISDTMLYRCLEEVRAACQDDYVSFFEGMTLAAFVAFAKVRADVTLMEVGMGGRLDATNVITNTLVSVITPISFDHTDFLGDTLKMIAYEKSGILRKGVPCVVGPQEKEALSEIEKWASVNRSPVFRFGHEWSCCPIDGGMRYMSGDHANNFPPPALSGMHQIQNAGTAIAVANILSKRYDMEIYAEDIEHGLRHTVWPARLTKIDGERMHMLCGAPDNVEMYVDGAHNVAGASALVDWLADCDRDIFLIVGLTKGKACKGFLHPFILLKDRLQSVRGVCVSSETNAYSAQEITDAACELGLHAKAQDSLLEALRDVVSVCKNNPRGKYRVVICGSLYLVGDLQKIEVGLMGDE